MCIVALLRKIEEGRDKYLATRSSDISSFPTTNTLFPEDTLENCVSYITHCIEALYMHCPNGMIQLPKKKSDEKNDSDGVIKNEKNENEKDVDDTDDEYLLEEESNKKRRKNSSCKQISDNTKDMNNLNQDQVFFIFIYFYLII